MVREPDAFSLDRVLGLRLPAWVAPVGLVAIMLTVIYSELDSAEQDEAQDESREELAGP
jgi:putative oxidoreductase